MPFEPPTRKSKLVKRGGSGKNQNRSGIALVSQYKKISGGRRGNFENDRENQKFGRRPGIEMYWRGEKGINLIRSATQHLVK